MGTGALSAACLANSSTSILAFSSSAFLRARLSASLCSFSLASCSALLLSRSSCRDCSSAIRSDFSSASRAFAACKAFIRRSISASVTPEGLVCVVFPVTCAPSKGFIVPDFGTTTRLRLVSTTTLLLRPWLKLCLTLPARGPPRNPRVFLPSLSLI